MRLQFKPSEDGLTRFYQLEIVPYLGDDEFKVFASWGKVDINGQDIVLEDKQTICRGTFATCEKVIENKINERKGIGYELVDASGNS